MKKIMLLFLIICFGISFTSANSFAYNYLETTTSSGEDTNYSLVNVNNSQFLQGYTPTTLGNLFLLNSGDTATGDYTFNGNINIEGSGSSRLKIGGSNLLYFNYSNYNLMIGAVSTGSTWTSANNNIVMGNTAPALTSGNNNIIMGRQAGRTITTGVGNVILGNYAGGNLPSGTTGNFVLGQESLRYTTGTNNVAIGSYTGTSFTAGGSNVMIGAAAGASGTGNLGYNVFLGISAGQYQQSGNNNILIGYNVSAPNLNGSNQINIGSKIYGLSNGNIGIGTSSPPYKLTVGNESNTNYSLISAYFEGNITSAGYITRTSVYNKADGNALDKVKDASYYLVNGKVDDTKFYGYTYWITNETDKTKPLIVNVLINNCSAEECYPYTKKDIIYPYTKLVTNTGVSLDKEIDLLRQAVYELKIENQELKQRLDSAGIK